MYKRQYWCFPREHFTDEELRLVRHADWARTQTINQILEIVRDTRRQTDDKTVESALSDLADQVSERMETRGKELELYARDEGVERP